MGQTSSKISQIFSIIRKHFSKVVSFFKKNEERSTKSVIIVKQDNPLETLSCNNSFSDLNDGQIIGKGHKEQNIKNQLSNQQILESADKKDDMLSCSNSLNDLNDGQTIRKGHKQQNRKNQLSNQQISESADRENSFSDLNDDQTIRKGHKQQNIKNQLSNQQILESADKKDDNLKQSSKQQQYSSKINQLFSIIRRPISYIVSFFKANQQSNKVLVEEDNRSQLLLNNQQIPGPSNKNGNLNGSSQSQQLSSKQKEQSILNDQIFDESQLESNQSQNVQYYGATQGDLNDLSNQSKSQIHQVDGQYTINNGSKILKANYLQKSYLYFCEINKNLLNLNEKIFSQIWTELEKKGYYLGKYLSEGGEGLVFEGYAEERGILTERVFKIIFDKSKNELEEEISIMSRFNNYHSVKFIDYIKVSEDISIFIIEKCKHSLRKELELIQNVQKNFKLRDLFRMILDLFDGLVQLKLYKILHLDIKPANILIAEDGSCVYADFGLSLFYSEDINSLKIKGCTGKYAPEEQKVKELMNLVSYKTDIYSLGLTIEQMLETFKVLNQSYDIIHLFEKQILLKMIDPLIENRMDINKCHENLIKILVDTNQEQILVQYSKKLDNILEYFSLDYNKNISDFLEIKIYYHLMKIKILELQISHKFQQKEQQNIQSNSNQNVNSYEFLIIKKVLSFQYFQLSLCYSTNGNTYEALQYSFQSLQIRKELFKGNHPDIATSLNNVGYCYHNIGDYERSLCYSLQSLEMRKELFKGNHPDIAKSLNNIGSSYGGIGDSQRGLSYSLQSLQMYQELFIENYPEIANSLCNVGSCYHNIGDSERALGYSLQSLQMRKELFDGNHPDIVTSLSNVGSCYRITGDSERALSYSLQSLQMCKELFNGNHPDIVKSLCNVGYCYRIIGDSEKALSYSLQSLQMCKELFIGNHPKIAQSLCDVGDCYRIIGDSEKALSYSLQSLQMRKELFDGNHPDIATSLSNVGSCYRITGDSERALSYSLQSLQMCKELFIGNHPEIATSLNNVGYCYLKIYDFNKALGYYLQSLQMRKELFKGNHPYIATSLNEVGFCYYGICQYQNALIYHLQSLQMRKELFKGNHPDIISSLNNVGLCYSSIGDSEKALSYKLLSQQMRKDLNK